MCVGVCVCGVSPLCVCVCALCGCVCLVHAGADASVSALRPAVCGRTAVSVAVMCVWLCCELDVCVSVRDREPAAKELLRLCGEKVPVSVSANATAVLCLYYK